MQSSKHHDSQFEVHTLPDWQPMELLQNWSDVLMSSHSSDQMRRGILDGLYASEQVVGDAVQKRIAVVQAVREKFDTGRKLAMSAVSMPGFFKRGDTMACFWLSGSRH